MLTSYSLLFPYLKQYKFNYLFGVISLTITSIGQLFIPFFIRQVIDLITQQSFEMSQITHLLGLMVLSALVVVIGRLGWRFWLHGAARKIEANIRTDLFHKYLLLGENFYQKQKIGDLLARGTNDLQAVRMASSMGLVAFFDGLFMTIAILIILFRQNASTTFLIILPLPIVTLLVLGLGKVIGKLFKQVQEGFSTLSQQSQEVFSNVKIVKSFVLESYFLNKFGESNDQYQMRNLQLVQIWGLLFPVVGFLGGITTVLLLIFGGRDVILGQLTPGEFVATLSYLQMLIWPMLGAGFTVNLIQRGAASLSRIKEIMDQENEFTDPLPSFCPDRLTASLEFQQVGFHYDAEKSILKNITLSLPKGKLIGILGPTGSGKTTLLKLLLRFQKPTEGVIVFDGKDISTFNPIRYRKLFGYISQDTFLFSDTIKNNISFAKQDASLTEIESFVKLSALESDLAQFPKGLETEIGERGITVSGGQKQRITIARALITQPEILLIDDGLSALDSKTEEAILDAILRNRAGKTTMLISHRVSALKHSDIIYVIEDGQITTKGTHEDLIEQTGFYQDIFQLQKAENQEIES